MIFVALVVKKKQEKPLEQNNLSTSYKNASFKNKLISNGLSYMEMPKQRSLSPSSLNVGITTVPRTSFQQQDVREKDF
ncbi:hypothetical protein CARUB_v10006160mg [Capsella rubella]|uniref:Uncharacterized protein n=1 Tax=Capsella rubella TaxID=81985 RepID=R0F7B0_9BRAS|nr:hypothetical protein CARUB_v10006160mg [Capsella rubella]